MFQKKTQPKLSTVTVSDGGRLGPPPTLEEIHAGASAASAYAKGIFQDAVEELVDANARFDDVEVRATSEIDRLTQLRDDAASQRRANVETIKNLQALIG